MHARTREERRAPPSSYAQPAAYEQFMGRWSACLALPFIRFAGVARARRVLDVGCGTGSLVRALLASDSTVEVVGVDPAAEYVAFARAAVGSARAGFEVAGAEALPFDAASFDATLALLVLQEFGDPARAVHEIARVTRCGGTVASCLWDFRDGMPMLSLFWQAAERVAPEAVTRHRIARPRRNPPGRDELAALWTACGLSEVRTESIALAMRFASFEDFWLPFLGGATPTSALAAMIDRDTGGALARALRDALPSDRPDLPFVLPARAWAVAGMVAG